MRFKNQFILFQIFLDCVPNQTVDFATANARSLRHLEKKIMNKLPFLITYISIILP